jgi:hypothetical protein
MDKSTREVWIDYFLSEALLWMWCFMLGVVFYGRIVFRLYESRSLIAILAPLAQMAFILAILGATWLYAKSLRFAGKNLRRFILLTKGLLFVILLVDSILRYSANNVYSLNFSGEPEFYSLEIGLMMEAVYLILALVKPKSVNQTIPKS